MDKDFFDSRLLYWGLDEFYSRKDIIKEILFTKSIKDQYLYKLYVYSRPFISDTWKDLMWDWLQGYDDTFEFVKAYRVYKQKHQK